MSSQASAIDAAPAPSRVAAAAACGEPHGRSSVAGAALSVVATKIFAAMLGPSEVAVLATLQQIRQAGVTGATLNGQTALVQGAERA